MILKWLQGKRTYVVAVATFIVGGIQAFGIPIAPWVYPLLAAAGLGGLRAGVNSAIAGKGGGR